MDGLSVAAATAASSADAHGNIRKVGIADVRYLVETRMIAI